MRQIALFPDDRAAPEGLGEAVQVRLKDFELHRPRQWGCLLAGARSLGAIAARRLLAGASAANPRGNLVAERPENADLLPADRSRQRVAPAPAVVGHERLGDLLGEDARLAESHKLYRCLDKLVEHKEALFNYLTERWKTLFDARFDVLLYDLTSTYFECDPPGEGKRKYGYSRDKRPDCVQVVIALIVTPEGLPLAYEVLAGNTSDKTTLADFLAKIEKQYGKAVHLPGRLRSGLKRSRSRHREIRPSDNRY